MIIDTRYHCASLAAVFLALGIGIAIGSLLVGDRITENILDEREKLVERLEKDYLNIKEEGRLAREEYLSLEKELEMYKGYAEQTIPAMVGGRLNGKKIMLIKEESNTIPRFFEESLRLAGAELVVFGTLEGDDAPTLAGLGSFSTGRLSGDLGDIDAVVMIDVRDSPATLPESISKLNALFYLETGAHIPEQVALILAIADREG